MANYECTVRTNYFRVKDPDAFREYMDHVSGAEDQIRVWNEEGGRFGFGCYGGIAGIPTEDNGSDDYDPEWDYDAFINGLREHVADNDAIIILEVGNEKLRYLCGQATIITSKEIKFLDMETLAVRSARDMLENPEYTTKCEY